MATSQIPYQIYMLLSMMTRRLDDHNFITWSYQFQTLLEGQDLFGYIDGSTLCPTKYVISDDDGVTNEICTSYKEWKKTDKAILSLLIASLSFDVMDYVVGSMTSREAWLRLKDRYLTNSRSHVMQLKTDLYTITKGMDSVEKYLLKVTRARNQLVALGVRMEDEDIVVIIVNGLPVEFNLIKAIIRARETPITMSELRILLLAAERDIARSSIHSTIQISVSQGYMVDYVSHIGNKALNVGCDLNYSGPPCTIPATTAHATDGTQSSCVSTCAHDFSSSGNSFDTHVGASPAVVHGREHIMINNDEADFYNVVTHVNTKSDDKVDCYVVDNCVSTDSDDHIFVESQNELEKVVDDVKSFNSADDQFCDSQQQLEKSEDDNNNVNIDFDEDMSCERRQQLQKLVDYSTSDLEEDLLVCSGSMWKEKYVATNEFLRCLCRRIGIICGDDCYESSGDKKPSKNIDINDVTMEYIGLFCCESCDGENTYYICNPVNKNYAVFPNTLLGVILYQLSSLFDVKEIGGLGNIKKGGYFSTLVMQKMVMKLESIIVDEKRVYPFSLMDEMEIFELKFNPQAVDISYPVMFQSEDFLCYVFYSTQSVHLSSVSKVLFNQSQYATLTEIEGRC